MARVGHGMPSLFYSLFSGFGLLFLTSLSSVKFISCFTLQVCLVFVVFTLTSVNSPDGLHLPLVCSFVYLSLVFPPSVAGSSANFSSCLVCGFCYLSPHDPGSICSLGSCPAVPWPLWMPQLSLVLVNKLLFVGNSCLPLSCILCPPYKALTVLG